jgi:hypothetical protein
MGKRTKLQTIRNSLMKQLEKIESGTAKEEEVQAIINIADVTTKTYNTELRAKELELSAEGTKIDLSDLDVFEDMQ